MKKVVSVTKQKSKHGNADTVVTVCRKGLTTALITALCIVQKTDRTALKACVSRGTCYVTNRKLSCHET